MTEYANPPVEAVAPVEPAPVVEAPRDPAGKFVSKDKPTNAREKSARDAVRNYFKDVQANRINDLTGHKEQPEAEPVKAEEPVGKPESPKVDTPEVQAAKAALRRLHVPKSVIDAMSDADLAEWQGAVSHVSEIDSAFSELGELRKRSKESPPKTAESAKPEQPVVSEPELPPLDRVLDEDAARAVDLHIKRLQAKHDSELGEIKAQLKSMVPEIERSKTERTQQLVEKVKAGLEKRFPQLGDKDFFSTKILPAMAQLNREGKDGSRPYSDPEKLMVAACRLECEDLPAKAPPPPKQPRAPSLIADTQRPRAKPRTVQETARLAWTNRHLSEEELDAKLRNTAS